MITFIRAKCQLVERWLAGVQALRSVTVIKIAARASMSFRALMVDFAKRILFNTNVSLPSSLDPHRIDHRKNYACHPHDSSHCIPSFYYGTLDRTLSCRPTESTS